jgi:hypothetical protein
MNDGTEFKKARGYIEELKQQGLLSENWLSQIKGVISHKEAKILAIEHLKNFAETELEELSKAYWIKKLEGWKLEELKKPFALPESTSQKKGNLEIIRNIIGSHKELVSYGIKILAKEDYDIFPETKMLIEETEVRLDIYARKGNETVAVECGTLSIPHKLEILTKHFSRVIWIPYGDRPLEEQQKR